MKSILTVFGLLICAPVLGSESGRIAEIPGCAGFFESICAQSVSENNLAPDEISQVQIHDEVVLLDGEHLRIDKVVLTLKSGQLLTSTVTSGPGAEDSSQRFNRRYRPRVIIIERR